METIIIHPNSKQQVKVFEEMATALHIPFEVKNTIEDESDFMKEFNAGIDLETAREISLEHVRKLWQK